MRMHRFSLAVLALSLVMGIASTGYAVSESAVLFLRIAPGSRAAGMGEAFVAISDDATATHWNPAGLGAYPLANTWVKATVPDEYRPLSGIAVLKKGKGSDYLDYDIWILGPQGLVRYDNKNWHTEEIFSTKTDETVEKKVRDYFNVSDEARLNQIIDKVAAANNQGTHEELAELRDQIMAAVREDYSDRGALTSGLDSLLSAYHLCLVRWDGVANIRKVFKEGFKDSLLTEEEGDRINFAVEKAVSRFIPEELALPYSAGFLGELTSVASDGDNLLVGTTEGLIVYNGLGWRCWQAESGLPSNSVTCLSNVGVSTLVGTDSGVVVFNGMALVPLDAVDSLPVMPVEAIGGSGPDDIYAVVNHDLYHYDGTTWSNALPYTVVLDDSPEAIAEKFALYGSAPEKDRFIAKFNQVDQPPVESDTLADSGMLLSPGATVWVPYLDEFKGEVSSIHVSSSGTLWIGTDHGVAIFDGETWRLPGYRRHTVQEGQTVDSLIALRSFASPEDAEAYGELMRKLSDLDEDELPAGSEVLVVDNPASAPVSRIIGGNDRVYVGTTDGLLEYDGIEWRRTGAGKLGYSHMVDVTVDGEEVWFAGQDRVVTRGKGRTEISLMHVNWLPEFDLDLYYEFLSYVKSTESWGTIGGNVTFLSYGSIQFMDAEGNPGDVFDAFEIAFTVSYGTALTGNLSGGISAKVIHSRLADQGQGLEEGDGIATGYGIDVGLLYKQTRRLTWGLAITNIGPKFSYIDASQSDDLPRNLAFGFAYKLLRSEYYTLLVTAEVNKTLVALDEGLSQEFRQVVLNGGAEFTYADMFSARAGYIYDQEGKIKTVTLGAGLALSGRFKFDFAYIPMNEDVALANTLRVSISVLP